MKSLREALRIFLEEAYRGKKVPESVSTLADSLSRVTSFEDLVEVQGVETPADGVVSVRLGNHVYPHMKLVIRKDRERFYFGVDTHDGPNRIPPSLPGYEQFQVIMKENDRIKHSVQKRFSEIFSVSDGAEISAQSRGRVLVVDDESFVRDILTRLLSSFGFEVLSAGSADDGLKLVRDNRFVCCFLDIMMPDKSGYQFIEELESEKMRDFPIIFVTGMHPQHIKEDIADELILKPFTASILKEKLAIFGLF